MIRTRTLLSDTRTPVLAYAALRKAAGDGPSFLLESAVAGERWGRYTVLGYKPRWEAVLDGFGRWTVNTMGRGDAPQAFLEAGDPLRAASRAIVKGDGLIVGDGNRPESQAERFARSHIGYFAWDLVHLTDKVPGFPPEELGPVARLMGGATIVVYDNLAQTVTIAAPTDADIDEALAHLQQPVHLATLPLPDRSRLPEHVEVSMDDARFEATVRRAQEYVAAGDTFQVQIGRDFVTPAGATDAFDVYRALRVINPSPYMYFLDLPPAGGEKTRTQIAGASPEILVRLEDGTVTIRPIAGTRRRGRTSDEDRALEEELLADPKERAEHVMLIDLARNDVGRVAQVGSVKVTRQMFIERYSHVMHIVSEVTGKVRPGTAPFDVLRATFPAGTLSGAPKVRSMQIIRELEGRPRGIYGGAIGYAADDGNLDFAIAIRTAVCRGGTFTVTAAAGVVEGSVPRLEALETRNKAGAVLSAIAAARGARG